MNYDRIYSYRFQGIPSEKKLEAWKPIAEKIYCSFLKSPKNVLVPAAGDCEFLKCLPTDVDICANDINPNLSSLAPKHAKVIVGDFLEQKIEENSYEGVFVSNFLEHLPNHQQVAEFLEKVFRIVKPGGRVAIMGPNFKYTSDVYFDCADHETILTHISVEEHLVGAGFDIENSVDRFLPFSFRGKLPAHPFLIRCYLSIPFAWKFLGKQFLVVGKKL